MRKSQRESLAANSWGTWLTGYLAGGQKRVKLGSVYSLEDGTTRDYTFFRLDRLEPLLPY